MKILYYIYQIVIALPLMLAMTLLCSLIVIIMAPIFGNRFWGNWIPRIWGRFICRVLLLPVKVEGTERIDKNQCYIFVANHQSMFDIFLMLGFLGHEFRWMMKKELANIPVVGFACKCAGFICINRTSKRSIAESMNKADNILKEQKSLAMFAEGTRTRDGKVGAFKRGAFKLAEEFGLPIVPISLNGCYEVMPKGRYIARFYPMRLVVHEPIMPYAEDANDTQRILHETRQAILSGLDSQYK